MCNICINWYKYVHVSSGYTLSWIGMPSNYFVTGMFHTSISGNIPALLGWGAHPLQVVRVTLYILMH